MMSTSFKDFGLPNAIQQTLDTLGFTTPTEIQAKAIPILLAAEKRDFHGQAQTGTGKTLAFGLPLLSRINHGSKKVQALVVAPTRELALQICDSLRPFAQALQINIEPIYGGVSMDEQIRALRSGTHLVIGTPGRLNDHLRRQTLDISTIRTLVLDEADIMLDMGFKDEVDDILSYAPKNREIWLFSATVKAGISTLMHEHMHDTVSVRVTKKNIGTPTTKQYYCLIPMRSRLNALCRFIESTSDFYGFIFCQTKILTGEIAEQLIRRGYAVGALHGDMSQAQRNSVIKKFKNKELAIVVATDVAARGIDIANLTYVVNYSLPEDLESYVHRVGRTGRAGKEGTAITFINKSEVRTIQHIQKKFALDIQPIQVPSREEIIKGLLTQAAAHLGALNTSTTEHTIHPEVTALIKHYTEQELRSLLARIVEEKFLSSILSEEESLSSAASHKSDATGNTQEIFLNVGLDDGVSREEILHCLTQTGLISENQIFKIRSIKRRTFIELPTQLAHNLLNALQGTVLAGRRIRASFAEEDQGDRSERFDRNRHQEKPSYQRRRKPYQK
jgi:ATP-dependent RNA helicase DeaD